MIIDTMALGPHDGTHHRWALILSDMDERTADRMRHRTGELRDRTGADAVLIFEARVTIGGDDEPQPVALEPEPKWQPLNALDLLDGPRR